MEQLSPNNIKNVSRRICTSCLSDCNKLSVPIDREVEIPFKIYNKHTNKTEYITLQCGVIENLQCDVIFGFNLLKQNNILKSILFHSLMTEEDIDEMLHTLNVYHSSKKLIQNETNLTIEDKLSFINTRIAELEFEKTSVEALRIQSDKAVISNQEADNAFEASIAHLSKRKRKILMNKRTNTSVRNSEVMPSDSLNTLTETELSNLPVIIQGDEEFRRQQIDICRKYYSCFDKQLRHEAALVPPMDVELDIDFDSRGNRQPPRVQGRVRDDEIANQVEKMLAANVVRISTASAHSQVLLVPKPDGSWRFCVDYRKLNLCTRNVSWPIPNIAQMLQRLGRKRPKYFGIMDLTKGYFQAPMSERSRHLTAFITARGLYEYNRVPMGLTGAPAYFQRVMSTVVLAGLIYAKCEVYMDDIIVFGTTKEEYLANLAAVLERLQKHRLTANPDKTRLGLLSVEYVGHTIDAEGLSFSREKLESVIQFPKPKTKGEMKSFLGLVNYLRDHIPNESTLCRPLQQVIKGYVKKQRKHTITWTEEMDTSWILLHKCINECPKLFWVDENVPIHLYTDASNVGMGAYLCQEKSDGKTYPIGIMSMTFTPTQQRWHTIEQECYAIVKALEKFDYLLRDVKFTLHTDHKNLTYVRDNINSSKKVLSWKLAIQEYMFDIVHVAGEDNPIADFFSRNTGAAVCQDRYSDEDRVVLDESSPDHGTESRREPSEQDNPMTYSLNALREDFVIPDKEYELIRAAHNEITGHTGVEKTIDKLLEAKHSFKYMRKYVEKFIRECPICQKNAYHIVKADIQPYTTGAYDLMQRINIDTIGPLPTDIYGYEYIIVVIDCFSRWVELYPSVDTSAHSAAKALLQFTGRFGIPSQIISDNGPQYHNELIQQFCTLTGSQQLLTVPYSKEENSIVERANKEVLRYIRDLCYKYKSKSSWSEHLPIAQRIINAMKKDITGYAPSELLYSGALHLNKHLLLQEKETKAQLDPININEWLKDKLTFQKQAIDTAVKNQKLHDMKHVAKSESGKRTEFSIGDLVLKTYPTDSSGKNGRPNKLYTNWTGPYTVLSVNGKEKDTYDIKSSNGRILSNISVHLLKSYTFDANHHNPDLEGLHDTESHLVEKIVSHKGTFTQKKKLLVEVKWLGYRDTTMEPWKNVMYNTHMHEYMRKHNFEKHIPLSTQKQTQEA